MKLNPWNLRALAAGVLLGLLPMITGCGGVGGTDAPPTGGAGIPGVRGPAASTKLKTGTGPAKGQKGKSATR